MMIGKCRCDIEVMRRLTVLIISVVLVCMYCMHECIYVWMIIGTYLFAGVFMNLLMHPCAYVYMDERTYALNNDSPLRHLFTHRIFLHRFVLILPQHFYP
jgi:uncharacterized membrane protein YagU involved in acid resistance